MNPTQKQIDALIIQILQAQCNWTGCDWPHDTPDGVCDGNNATTCDYCRVAGYRARAAAGFGAEAIEALEKRDWQEVVEHLTDAQWLEQQYGDAPTWGPILAAYEKLSECEEKE